MADLLEKMAEFMGAGSSHAVQTWPSLDPRVRRYKVVSVDDHFIEPPDIFAGRLPARYADTGPHVARGSDDVDYWVFGDQQIPLMGSDAIQSWLPGKGRPGPVKFEDLRPGTWRLEDRVRDMDVAGIAASLNFPSSPFGFAGQRFMAMKDTALGLAAMRAYNDWVIEEWTAPYPDRMIPCQVTWLLDPEVAGAEIRQNAERGFKAVSFSENPEKLGLPSIYKPHWDPVFKACEETGTVVNLHVGSSSETLVPSSDSPVAVLAALFPVNGFSAAVDWLFARIPVRFPGIRIAFSEGGIGWVPMLLDRLRYMERYGWDWAEFGTLSPPEVVRRNYWFTTFGDPTTLELRHAIGIDRIMVEVDYPHGDSSWPDTQSLLQTQFQGIPEQETDLMTHLNAARLYRHGDR